MITYPKQIASTIETLKRYQRRCKKRRDIQSITEQS